MLAAEGARPTAIFAANNFIAFGAIRALREAGLRVPEDMSVVAFDDLPEEWVSEPFLTVAAQPAYEIGRRAATLLLDRIAGDRDAVGASIVLPVRADHPAVQRAAPCAATTCSRHRLKEDRCSRPACSTRRSSRRSARPATAPRS